MNVEHHKDLREVPNFVREVPVGTVQISHEMRSLNLTPKCKDGKHNLRISLRNLFGNVKNRKNGRDKNKPLFSLHSKEVYASLVGP